MTKIEDWLYDIVTKNGKDIDRTENFVELGAVDSLSLLELVEAIEIKYNFRFVNRDFLDRRFLTVAGLAEIVNEKLGLQS